MKANTFYLLLLLPIIAFTACKKAPVRDQSYATTFTKPCIVNGADMIDVIFVSYQVPGNTSVYVYFRNAGSSPIYNAKVYIEMCTALPQNYDNCPFQWTIDIDSVAHIDSLAVNDTTGYQQLNGPQLLLVNQPLTIDSSHINVGILRYDALSNNNPLAGNYFVNNESSLTSTTGNIYDMSARGYVFFDGTSTFRFKMYNGVTTYYNVYGSFIDSASINEALLNSANTVISSLSLGGPQKIIASNATIQCTFNINTPIGDTINAININLSK